MTEYMLKAVLCSLLFFALYKLLLEREHMYRFNRIYLLGSLVVSLLVPLVTFTVTKVMPILEPLDVGGMFYGEPAAADMAPYTPDARPFDWGALFVRLWFATTAFMLLRFLWSMASIYVRIRRSEIVRDGKAVIVLVDGDTLPHTFLKYIFISRDDYRNNRIEHEILLHEWIHVAQRHSLDKILVELLIVSMWFNPVIYLYKRSIYLNHEFLADEGVFSRFDDPASYQQLLIHRFSGAGRYPVASPFSFLITKKRLIMMTKRTSRGRSLAKALATLPMLAVAVFAFSGRTVVYAQPAATPAQEFAATYDKLSGPEHSANNADAPADGIDGTVRAKRNLTLEADYIAFDEFTENQAPEVARVEAWTDDKPSAGPIAVSSEIIVIVNDELKLRGVVADDLGPLSKVSVYLVTSRGGVARKGVMTGHNGEYVLDIGKLPKYPEGQTFTIVFSLPEYTTQVFPYEGQTQLDVLMKQTPESAAMGQAYLEEGMARAEAQKPERESEFFGNVYSADFLSVSGPGAGAAIRVRGASGVLKVVVDGNPVDNAKFKNFDFADAEMVDIATALNMKPDDISTIELIKDQAATAAWGPAAANWVLIVTTKKAAAGSPLMVLDGVVMDNVKLPKGFDYTKAADKEKLAALLNIQPHEIQGIATAPGAAAASQWGPAAANGALIVMTKTMPADKASADHT